jgi:DNA polymerase-1
MRNPYNEWHKAHIDESNVGISYMSMIFNKDKPTIGGLDTETTGLHIIKDKAFLIVFGWLVPNTDYGRVFTLYPTPDNMRVVFELCGRLAENWLHNVKYDVHMMANTGYNYPHSNLHECLALARLTLEAIPIRFGGDSLKLKHLGEKYVHPQAANSDRMVKEELERLNGERISVLSAALKQFDHPTDISFKPFRLDTGKGTTGKWANENPDQVEWKTVPCKWSKGRVEDFLKDRTNELEDLPDHIVEVWKDWLDEYPEPTYEDIDRELMIKYAGEDVITMLEFVKQAKPILKQREQQEVLERENKCIMPFYRMERTGMNADQAYLQDRKSKMKAYIIRHRRELIEIAGEQVKVGQHERLTQIFQEKWDITLPACDKPNLKKIFNNPELSDEIRRFARLIIELRSLEKWYSTYLLKIIEDSSYDGRFYTQIHQCSAVSGRVSSNAQQFPRDAVTDIDDQVILADDGEQLFNPRKVFIPTGNGYDETYYVDYDQMELAVQADYTIRVSGGDLNLCRAFMPFKCFREGGIEYSYSKPEEIKMYDWFTPEGEPWTPTDIHSATGHSALLLLGYDYAEKYEDYTHPEVGFYGSAIDEKGFKKVRRDGKTVNFAKNYGVGLATLCDNLSIPEHVGMALIKGYEDAFPHVIIYQRQIQKVHRNRGYIRNHYNRRYYLKDTNSSYKLANYTIQGTCADGVKEAIIKVDEYIQTNQLKTRLVLPVHDEIIIEPYKGEESHIEKIREIMEKEFDWCYIPITCGVDKTNTNWSEKHAVN